MNHFQNSSPPPKSSAFSPLRMANEKVFFPSASSCPPLSPNLVPYPAILSPPAYLQRYCGHEYGMFPFRDTKGLISHLAGPYLPHGAVPVISFHHPEEEKPTQSYIGLIGKAILSSPQKKLVLSDIYNHILTNYPYFRNKGPGWRNSIRHNLSLNECFVKVGRSPNGKGHFWAINPTNYDDFSRGEYRRKRASKKKGDNFKSESDRVLIAPKIESDALGSAIVFPSFSTQLQQGKKQQGQTTNCKQNKGFHIETLLSTDKTMRFTDRTDR